MSSEDVKPKVKPDPAGGVEKMEIKLKLEGDDPITFRVKATTLFSKVVTAWGQQKGVNFNEFRFIGPEGDRIKVGTDQTLQDIGLEDGDQISVETSQIGGRR